MLIFLQVAVLILILVYKYSLESTNITFYPALRNSQDSEMDYENKKYETLTKYRGQKTKYIVYDCTKARNTSCSGWSDRIAGIMTTFIISILAKRQFLINFDTPCLLQDYVVPAHYDWRYNSSILVNRTSSYHYLKGRHYKKIDKYMFGGSDFNTYFKHDVDFLLMNWDFINEFRKRPNIAYDIPWITKYHQVDIYKHVYNLLFKLSSLSVHALNRHYRTKRRRNKIACAHIRIGENPNMPEIGTRNRPVPSLKVLWDYFDSLNKNEYDLFIASDTDGVKTFAKERYPENMIDTPGKITHIDQPYKNDPVEGFLKQLLDFYILSECDILVIPPKSGFSMLAAFIRNKDDGIFCLKKEELVPCSRYTMTDILPEGKFGIKLMGKIGKQRSTS
ncbi:uncharacterized protein LOC117322824 [Pecten maximus]|uniref:uncharacterized protein LOC117322824 n=1 Tax=Pecten maximus TaxID=6579 RepID=UPI001458B53D|nr:uncharacterized protein LOC117322824 [Pecten maximus]